MQAMRDARNGFGRCDQLLAGVALAVTLSLGASTAWADSASGTLNFQSKSGPIKVEVKHAYLIAGSNWAGEKIRRVLLSPVDLSAALQKCTDMLCTSGELGEGLSIDFDSGPRLGYWFGAKNQMIQHSAGVRVETFEAEVDEAERIAGKWTFDDTQGGGPNIDVRFDARLIKAFD